MSEPNGDFPADTFTVRDEIRNLIGSMVDEGTDIDGGGGFGACHLWFTVGGRQFSMEIKEIKKAAHEECRGS